MVICDLCKNYDKHNWSDLLQQKEFDVVKILELTKVVLAPNRVIGTS